MEIFLLISSCLFFISSILLRRKANMVADSNKLFTAAQYQKLKEEKKSIENYRAESENFIITKARQEKDHVNSILKKNEVLLFSIKESSLNLADHHNRFEGIIKEFAKSRNLDSNKVSSLISDSVNYRILIESNFYKTFGFTIDDYKSRKVSLN